jgi:ribulose-5-phosphate 4-epimerase/fuculose-1-phosphate aldolase
MDLMGYVTEVVRENPGIKSMLMCDHGIIAFGLDLVNSYNLADLTEDSAKVAWLAQNLRADW